MIDLTPLEVRLKKGDFRRGFRGYDTELVDDFLDLISDRMEELVKQNRSLQESVEALESEVASYRNKERALSDALMTAQRLREDAKAHAQKEGDLLIREARMTAEVAREEATRALAREEEALRQARARRAQMVESFRRLLERELSELDVIEESLELREGGAPHGDAPPTGTTQATEAAHGTAADAGTEIGGTPGGEASGETGSGADTLVTSAEPDRASPAAPGQGSTEAGENGVDEDEEEADGASVVEESRAS